MYKIHHYNEEININIINERTRKISFHHPIHCKQSENREVCRMYESKVPLWFSHITL